jgi:hypothetical protein
MGRQDAAVNRCCDGMAGMAHWAVVLSAETFAAERLFANDSVKLPAPGPAPGDSALVVTGDEPELIGLGRVMAAGTSVEYTHRLFDDPVPLVGLPTGGTSGVVALDAATYEAWASKVGADRRVDAAKRTWLVSVDLPIEAPNAAEAVRAFWSYVFELGPRELPAFVAPSDDELAMHAYVLGTETNLDPEDDD